MTTVVLDSADQIEALNTGKVPVPKAVAADNARQAAKREALKVETKDANGASKPANSETKPSPAATNPDPAAEAARAVEALDDIEGDDGLTPRQKREFTESMRKTIAKKHRAQKEAEELAASEYNRARLAEERAAAIERENARLKAERAPAAAAVEAKPPKREDFQTDDAYAEALIDYRVDQKFKASQAEAAQRAAEARQAELVQQARARIERAIEIVPDFKEVTEAVDLEVPPAVAGYMQKSALFAEIAYHLAKHPDELVRIAKLPPDEQLVEIGEIRSKLTPFAPKAKATNGAEPSPETGTSPSKSRAAPIIRPLSGGAAPAARTGEEMQVSDHLKIVQQRAGTNLLARKRH